MHRLRLHQRLGVQLRRHSQRRRRFLRLLLVPTCRHALHLGGGGRACSGCRHDHLPPVRDASRRGRPHECGVWKRRERPVGGGTFGRVQQHLQHELECVGHQSCVFAGVPRARIGHLRNHRVGRSRVGFWLGRNRRPKCCGRPQPTHHAILLGGRGNDIGKQHDYRRVVVHLEHSEQWPCR